MSKRSKAIWEEAGGPSKSEKTPAESANKRAQRKEKEEADDARLRFTVGAGGRRMSKAEFISQISALDPKARAKFVEQSDVPQDLKDQAHEDAHENRRPSAQRLASTVGRKMPELQDLGAVPEDHETFGESAALKRVNTDNSTTAGPEGLALIDSNDEKIPFHDVRDELRNRETAAERRRREARTRQQPTRRQSSPPPRPLEPEGEDSEDDGTDRIPPPQSRPIPAQRSTGSAIPSSRRLESDNEGETAAERRRREGALGLTVGEESDSEEDDAPRQAPQSITFAEPQRPEPAAGTGRLRWGTNRRG